MLPSRFVPGLIRSAAGTVIGQLDRAYGFLRTAQGPKRPLLFSNGWGDLAPVEEAYHLMTANLKAGAPWPAAETAKDSTRDSSVTVASVEPRTLVLGWETSGSRSSKGSAGGLRTRTATAVSPAASVLASGAPQTMQVMYVDDGLSAAPWDTDADAAAPPARVVLLLPATGEQGFAGRLAVARALLARSTRGSVACVLLMAPYYAQRKPEGQRGAFVTTVRDYLAQSLAIMTEGAWLLGWAHNKFPDARLVVSGFSWGAAMSGCASLLATTHLPSSVAREQLSVVPYVGSCSPEPVLVGVLRDDVDWAALRRDTSDPAGCVDPQGRLLTIMREVHLNSFVDAIRTARPTGPVIAASHTVIMDDDHFVPKAFSAELAAVLASVADHGGEDHYPGGHLAAFLTRTHRQVDAILRVGSK